jgi:hypothetical protein
MNQPTTPAGSRPLPDSPALAAVLSYCVPGLGQIYQGGVRRDRQRLFKGVFFLVTLLGMFFFGMWLSEWKNVYLPRTTKEVRFLNRRLPGIAGAIWTRLHFAAQFWIGMAAWPAIVQYYHYSPYYADDQKHQYAITERALQGLRDEGVPPEVVDRLEKMKGQPARSQDEFLAAVRQHLDDGDVRQYEDKLLYNADGGHPVLGHFQRQTPEEHDRANALQMRPDMGRKWDIAWVYTVLAGLLNILVIYDAYAGPVLVRQEPARQEPEPAPPPQGGTS